MRSALVFCLVAAFSVSSLLSSSASAQPRSCAPEKVGVDSTRLGKIADVLEAERERARISGAVTLVAKEGAIVDLTAVGLADLEADRKMTERSLFAIASMTKPVTATGLMMLVEEGKVSLDDPVSKYIPVFAQMKLKSGEETEPVTVKHCLTHTAGLHGNQQVVGSLEEHMTELVKRGLAFPPGTKWQYSPGLNVCGRIIEVVSGKPYHVFLQQRIFDPLQMTGTSFFPTEQQRQQLVRIYQPGETDGTLARADHWLHDFSEERVANPSGGLISHAEDMAKFYQCILDGGVANGRRLISEQTIRQMTTIQTGDLVTGFTPGNGWGLGWCVVREPQEITADLSVGTYGHGGLFGTQGWVDPERRMIFVLMIQRSNFGGSDSSELRRDFQHAAVEALK